MTPSDFLRSVWPDEGIYCVATPFQNGGMNHKVFEDILAAANYIQRVSATENVYFATHALKAERIWTQQHHKDKETKAWVPGWSVRTQANARASKVLFFDLDVDPSKPSKYPTQAAAVIDLKRFVRETGLPIPMVVSSGGGLHVYWILDRALASASEWLTQAARLKQLAGHHGLKFDPSRTTDSASVLRVAGTFNLKGGAARPVSVLVPGTVTTVEDWTSLLDDALDAVSLIPAPAKHAAVVTGLGSNTKREFDAPPPPMVALIKACAQMQRLALLKGNNSEPEWYHGDVGVVLFTKNGRENVHKISQGHPNYTRAETDAKIDQWSTGPTTCAKLAEVCGPAHEHLCASCPAVKQNSSPVWIASLLDKAPPPVITHLVGVEMVELSIPDPPMPYKRVVGRGIEMLIEGKDGKQFSVPIYPYDLYPLERSTNASQETEKQMWRVHLPHSQVKDFAVEASAFVDDRALQVRLANNGIYAPKFPDLRSYMSAYIQELQRLRPVSVQHNHLGWIEDHTKFVMPEKVFHPDSTVQPAALSAVAAGAKDFVGTKGTLAEQVRLMKFFDHPAYVPNQFYILASLGAAIFFATGHHGTIIHATGEAGASKSTALYTAASIWGPPLDYVLNGTAEGATALARNARRDILSNLPTCVDEITHIAADVAKTFTMNVTQPGKRIRLKQDGTTRDTGTPNDRASMILTTANCSLHSLLQIDNTAGTAGSVRVFEILFEKRGIHLPHEANAFLRGIKENYGHIGERFIQVVVAKREMVVKRVIKVMEDLGIAANMREEERFWFAAAAAALVAGDLANKLGLLSYDIAKIEHWIIHKQLPQMRGTVMAEAQSMSALSTLMDYLEHINGDMIKMARPHSGNLPYPMQLPRGQMLGHYDLNGKVIYVLKDGFRRWCERRGQYSQAILKELCSPTGVVPLMDVKRTLGQGTDHAKGRSNCFVVNMTHRDVSGVQLAVTPPPAVAAGQRPNLKVV